MSDEPQASAFPHGFEDDFPDGPPTVVVTHLGCQLILRFAPGDFMGEGQLQELRLLPGTKNLRPRVLADFVPKAERYLAFARAAMRILGPEGTPETRIQRHRDAAKALREISGPGRRLSDEFYRLVAANYNALVAEGEPHPVKALSKIHNVTIGAASRWISEARRRKLIHAREVA